MARHARMGHPSRFRDVDSRGFPPLRQALAHHLRAFRGVRCDADQIFVLPGTLQALDVVARLLLDPGEPAWLEDPGYFGARLVLESAEVDLVPVPVDGDGLDVGRAIELAPHARLAYVTPAHQAPLGSTLSLERRLRLLDWADRESAWIFEDDYDSEFRYEGRPLPALQGLDERGVVLHAGTLSKVMFPGLRISYLVVPNALVEPLTGAFYALHRYVPLVAQAAIADFIAEGDLGRHIRRARKLYAERREALVAALTTELPELRLAGASTGMQLLARLPRGVSDRAVSATALQAGLETVALSSFRMRASDDGGLVLGFAAVEPARTRRAVSLLREVLRSVQG
jgi:GntR family transcriptional regulator/MocR family aminotransferase